MSDLADDPERQLTLRQAAQAGDDFAQVMDELEFMKSQLSQLPTAQESGVCPLAHNVRQCGSMRWARHHLVRGALAALPLIGAKPKSRGQAPLWRSQIPLVQSLRQLSAR